jgi:formylglycine-generating enzyme required for sulfatase activity
MKQKLKIMANLLLTAAFAAIFASCGKDDPKPVEATGVTLDRKTLALVVGGDPATLKATVTPDNATDKTVTWTSSAPGVATVTDGVVTAVAEGTATITAATANGRTDACTVTVDNAPVPATDVTLDRETLDLVVGGDPVALTATVIPADATDKTVTWTSSAPEIATVEDGVVTALAKGTATVTVSTANGKTDACAVTVEEYPVETALIPKGTFLMGSSDGSAVGAGTPGTDPNVTPAEPDRVYGYYEEISRETQHKVTLTQDYYMSKYQITNAQYAAYLNEVEVGSSGAKADIQGGQILIVASRGSYDWGLHHNGSRWEPVATYENHPVIFVTWYGAKAYAEWAGGDLPTEAQWERAVRGGVENMPFGIGDGTQLIGAMANFNGRYPYDLDGGGAYYDESGAYVGHTTAAGSYSAYANAYGLYDMYGNVWEWCLDQWDGSSGYASSPVTDPVGTAGSYRVRRGGSWSHNARSCRSAYRSYNYPDDDFGFNTGFRVVFYP